MASPRCRCTPRSRRRSPCNGTPLVPRRRPSSRRSLPTQPALRFAPSPFCQIKWNVSISESRKNIGKKYLFSDVFKNKNRVKKEDDLKILLELFDENIFWIEFRRRIGTRNVQYGNWTRILRELLSQSWCWNKNWLYLWK